MEPLSNASGRGYAANKQRKRALRGVWRRGLPALLAVLLTIPIVCNASSVTASGIRAGSPHGSEVRVSQSTTRALAGRDGAPADAGIPYSVSQSVGAAIVRGTTDIGNHCDDCTTNITLPFPYQLYSQTFTSSVVSSNGVLSFGGVIIGYSNTCLPYSSFTTDAIFAQWDDLTTNGHGHGIFTSVSGEAPNRIFNIEWRTDYHDDTSQQANFEVRLYENQPRFDIIYGVMDQGGSSATVGVQQSAGSSYTQFECNSAGSVFSGLELTFTLAGGLEVTPPSGYAGQNVAVDGAGYVVSEPVTLYWDSATKPVTTTTASSSGTFATTVTVPAALTYGLHSILAVGQSSGITFSVPFRVTPIMVLTPSSGISGTAVSAQGDGFGATEGISLTWKGVSTINLGTTTSSPEGRFVGPTAIHFTVPAVARGTYSVCATGQSSGAESCRDFIVTG